MVVEVADVVVALVARRSVMVEEASEMNPELKRSVVDVEFSPVPRVVHGKAKVIEFK
jgi:hypothetical protein